jgi:sirohydrochlorin ferrochelatase
MLRDTGLLLCVHGGAGGPGSAGRHARALRRRRLFREVRVCCLKGRPTLAEALARMRASRVHLVPLLMTEGYAATRLLPQALRAVGRDRDRLRLGRPIGARPGLAEVIRQQALAACRAQGFRPEATALLLAAHGTPRHRASGESAERHAARLRKRGEFARVAVAFLEQSPRILPTLRRIGQRPCIAVGLFADRGQHGESDVVRLITAAGTSAVYAGPIGLVPALRDLVLEEVRAAARTGRVRPGRT